MINITLVDDPLFQVSVILEDDKTTTKNLWYDLNEIYRMFNTEMVINLQPNLEMLSSDKEEYLEKHVEKVHSLTAKLD